MHVHTNGKKKRWEIEKRYLFFSFLFKQASVSVHIERMLRVMKSWGFEEGLLKAVEELYGITKARVWNADIITDTFPTLRGIIQGCPHSSHLFNLYLERIMLEALEGEEGDIEISGVRYIKPRYADDIVVAAVTTQDMQRVVQKVEEQCKRWKPEFKRSNSTEKK